MRVYEKVWRSKEAVAGDRTVWELPWFHEGFLSKVLVKSVGDAPGAFTVKIYNSGVVARNSVSSGGPDPDGDYASDPETNLVMPAMQSAAGESILNFLATHVPYKNQDGVKLSDCERKIYVEISIPAGSGLRTFDVALGGYSDIS